MDYEEINELLQEGDELVRQGKIEEGIAKYEEVFVYSSAAPELYLNVATLARKINRWDKVLDNTNLVLDMDDTSLKAFLYRGEAYIELAKNKEGQEALDKMQKGIENIEKALSLAIKQDKPDFEQRITESLLIGKKIMYYKRLEKERDELADIEGYLDSPIDNYSEN